MCENNVRQTGWIFFDEVILFNGQEIEASIMKTSIFDYSVLVEIFFVFLFVYTFLFICIFCKWLGSDLLIFHFICRKICYEITLNQIDGNLTVTTD